MSRFGDELLVEDNTWSSRYNIAKNDRYSDTSTQGTKLSLNFQKENYVKRINYDQIDKPHADMCFSKIIINHSVQINGSCIFFKRFVWINTPL